MFNKISKQNRLVVAVLSLCFFLGCSCDKNGTKLNRDTQTEDDTYTKKTDSESTSDLTEESETTSDSDIFEESDSETEKDTVTSTDNPWLPKGCRFIDAGPVTRWQGIGQIYDDKLVWSDNGCNKGIIMITSLSTGETKSLTDCAYHARPSIYKNWVFWETQLDGANGYSTEIFGHNLNTGETERLTNNNCIESHPMAGENYVVYLYACIDTDGKKVNSLRYIDLSTKDRKVYDITDKFEGNPSGWDFDGERWVTWVYKKDNRAPDLLYKYDIIT
jgi:hypothetical protein